MRKHIHNARDLILPLIDFFYPLFRKFMGQQTYRYAAAGGMNTVLGLVVYSISFKYILHEHDLDLGFYAFKSHIAAMLMAFCISFPMGFFLMKYVVFSNSNVKGRVQLFRYFTIYVSTLVLNYFLLKFFVEVANIYPILAQIITTVVIVIVSYVAQRHFTFEVTNTNVSKKLN